MEKNKIKNPYQRLLEEMTSWCGKVRYRHTVPMWAYPKNNLNGSWNLTDLYERVAAAEQIGYDVILTATETDLIVRYVKKVPDVPSEWR